MYWPRHKIYTDTDEAGRYMFVSFIVPNKPEVSESNDGGLEKRVGLPKTASRYVGTKQEGRKEIKSSVEGGRGREMPAEGQIGPATKWEEGKTRRERSIHL